MRLEIEMVLIPPGSTLGYGIGVPEDDRTKQVLFAGDARPMSAIGEAISASDAVVVVDVPDFAVIEIRELPER